MRIHKFIKIYNSSRSVQLLKRYGKFCAYCGCEMQFTPNWAKAAEIIGLEDIERIPAINHDFNPKMPMFSGSRMITIEHIKPRVLGGSNGISNLKLVCMKCNSNKNSDYRWNCSCGQVHKLNVNYCYKCGSKFPKYSGVDYKMYYESRHIDII